MSLQFCFAVVFLTFLAGSQADEAARWKPPPVQHNCCFKFTHPQLPSFHLPAAQPQSPGDVVLSDNNTIIFSNGQSIPQGQVCNGNNAEYLGDDGQFHSTFVNSNGQTQSIGTFYANGFGVNARTIQQSESNLAQVLNGRLVRLFITCANTVNSCIDFTIQGQQLNTIPNVPLDQCLRT